MFNENEVMTLTHCRFDARAKYGIQKIIVVDTDEFLFCGFPKSIAEARRNIDSMIETYSDAGHTEISFQQRAPCSRNVLGQGFGLIECAKAAIIRNAIVLGCYSSSDFFGSAKSQNSTPGLPLPVYILPRGMPLPSSWWRTFLRISSRISSGYRKFTHVSLKMENFELDRFFC